MFVIKVDLPTGVAFFTGKKRIVQEAEFPGLSGNFHDAKIFDDSHMATKYCKMLINRYDMNFYYSVLE